MRSDATETRGGWTGLFLTAAGVVILAASLVAGAVTAPPLLAQAPAGQTLATPAAQSLEAMEASGIKMAFDVASVKRNKSGDPRGQMNVPLGGDGWVPTGGHFSVTNLPLLIYISFAYN